MWAVNWSYLIGTSLWGAREGGWAVVKMGRLISIIIIIIKKLVQEERLG